ncbi:solute carrier family 2, facilitated glucose transporter member 3-like [Penaeus indicus]|uniref:solute carrier family 2, facilitated glucose transporter member 3-like n=1 Tax=Penaeus indicus TaxID=29960 RepID=UPI00300D6FD9
MVIISIGGLNARLAFAIAAAAFGSAFQHGYNLGVMNAPLGLIEDWLNQTSATENEVNDTASNSTRTYMDKSETTMIVSIIVSIYCVGGMVGGSLTGFFANR